jgi:hypothetical protein
MFGRTRVTVETPAESPVSQDAPRRLGFHMEELEARVAPSAPIPIPNHSAAHANGGVIYID